MSTYLSPDVRCPQCSAHVRAGTSWCTLCFADMRPASVAQQAVAGPGRRGRHSRREPVRADAEVSADAVAAAEQLADQLLAELAAGSANPLGPVASRVDTGAKRAAVMVGGGVLAMILLFLVMAMVGALL